MADWELLVDGVDFGEGPRWHEGRLWYSDFFQRAVYSVGLDGDRRVEVGNTDDRPSGLGWLSDGSLIAVFMTQRKLMRHIGGDDWEEYADLSKFAAWHCNDMVIDERDVAYVGNFGFDLEGRASFETANLIIVRADRTVALAADDMKFPNGSVITPDGVTLIVGESFGGDYIAFTIQPDGSLTDRRVWAEIPGTAPDGCALDADGGIWFSDAIGSQVVRVKEGGEVTDRVPTPQPTYACALGGADGTTLFALCAPGSHPDEVAGRGGGAIYARSVIFPGAGRP